MERELMREIIRRREIVIDDWRTVDEDPEGENGALILPLARWHAERERWSSWSGRVGVRISPADRVELLRADLSRLSLIAIEFPTPSEGRGYSQARVLRDRLKFTGEIRAVGHIKRDQIFFMARCGIDAFELAPGVNPQSVLGAFDDFDMAYQPSSVQVQHQRDFYAT
jgi:uncharacterized protein (DUF934 family)